MGNSTVDINLHDFALTPILLFLFWIIYLLTQKVLYSQILSWAHIMLTMLTCVFFSTIPYILAFSFHEHAGMTDKYFFVSRAVNATFLTFIAGQLVFLVNLCLGLYKRLSSPGNR
jgi:hypothetical protein